MPMADWFAKHESLDVMMTLTGTRSTRAANSSPSRDLRQFRPTPPGCSNCHRLKRFLIVAAFATGKTCPGTIADMAFGCRFPAPQLTMLTDMFNIGTTRFFEELSSFLVMNLFLSDATANLGGRFVQMLTSSYMVLKMECFTCSCTCNRSLFLVLSMCETAPRFARRIGFESPRTRNVACETARFAAPFTTRKDCSRFVFVKALPPKARRQTSRRMFPRPCRA